EKQRTISLVFLLRGPRRRQHFPGKRRSTPEQTRPGKLIWRRGTQLGFARGASSRGAAAVALHRPKKMMARPPRTRRTAILHMLPAPFAGPNAKPTAPGCPGFA